VTNQKIFCNTPWYELQIYWDGSLGICCQEDHKLYPDSETQYNIATMSIANWFNSEPARKFRLAVAGNTPTSACRRCYTEETYSGTSRRHRSNQKSVIFTRTAFDESYQQSPGYDKFESSLANQGFDSGMPIDLHIDLGNYCNLTCKMCNARASSSIAAQYVKWGIAEADKYIGSDWTRNEEVWQRTLAELVTIKKLHNIHFMGGETLITSRFEDFVDYMIEHGRTDLHFSFVTNGTTFNQSLLDKLKKFQRVGIEVSIESLRAHNAYQRQGTDTQLVMSNLERYLNQCNGSGVTLTARPAISALTIGTYWTLLEYCYNKKIIVKNLLVNTPQFLDVRVLPDQVRSDYIQKYKQLERMLELEDVDPSNDYNESDPNQIAQIIKNQINQCVNLLASPRLPDNLLTEMVQWCRRWDNVHGYNALDLYPELAEEFINRGY
jgi:molybdenum cofactor biosynthesis enzyme MoaA